MEPSAQGASSGLRAEPTPTTTEENEPPAPTSAGAGGSLRSHAPGIVALLVALLLTLPQLPAGVCLSDSGGLQTAAATLGITHPPGYPLLALFGYPLAHLPGLEPARWISVACLLCGLGACAAGYVVATRVGVRPSLAAGAMLLLVAQPRMWQGTLVPEVYVPTLFMMAAGALALQTHERRGGRRSLLLAGLAFGCALATRPPMLFCLPFVAIGAARSILAVRKERRERVGEMLLFGFAIAAPVAVAGSYLLVRDAPSTPYNYLDTHNGNWEVLPDASEGFAARVERVWWLVSGKQFANKFGNTWKGVRTKLRWLFRNELIVGQSILSYLAQIAWMLFAAAWLLAAIWGWWMLRKRSRVLAWVLPGFFVQAIVFICAYRIHGQAANYLPLLWAAHVVFAVAAGGLLARFERGRRSRMGEWVLLGVCVWIFSASAVGRGSGAGASAESFLADVQLCRFPDDAVLIADWRFATPLWYEQFVRCDRPDLLVIAAEARRANQLVDRYSNREVFLHTPHRRGLRHDLEPYRNFYRVVRRDGEAPTAHSAGEESQPKTAD